MKLKTLEISGFKSFADKTKIEFMPGMTGIVGPNGSGKSNIIEAIRWVLGEQSAKDLRGNKMSDVIFAGAANRKPLNRAEVSITFDNTDHYLKSDFSEVKVTRRLFRNGEADYLINGQDCRLRDILNLFMDTGLGRESFSIISQGRVEAIFNSKPEDRRSIIEEVAGVYKYKQNKEKAQKELTTTSEYLDRVNDIIAELESQLEPLAEQSALAKDYLAQKQRYDQLDQSRLVLEIQANRTAKQTVDQQITRANQQVSDYEIKVKEQMAEVDERKQRRAELTTTKDQLQDRLVQLTEQVATLTGQQANVATRTQFQQRQLAELNAKKQEVVKALTRSQAELAQLSATIDEQTDAVNNAQATVAALAGDKLKQQQAKLTDRLSALQDEYVSIMQTVTTLHNERQFLVRSHEQGSQQQSRLTEQTHKLTTQVADIEQQLNTTAEQVTAAKTDHDQLQDQLEKARQQHQLLSQQFDQEQKNWYNALNVQQRAKARAESLSAANSDYAGFYQGVKAILAHRQQFTGLVGPVADLLTVPQSLTKAIETALGAQLQQLVVKDEQTARDAVHYLTQQRAGRATFLPLTTIHGRTLIASQLAPLRSMTGYVGLASELVTYQTQVRPVVDYLLGTTIVATDLDAAIAIAKQGGHRFRIVTQDGQVMNASGSITGGANRHQTSGLLSQRAEIDELNNSIDKMQQELRQQEQSLHERQQRLDDSATAGAKLRDQTDQAAGTLQRLQGQATLINEQLTVAKRRLAASQLEQQQQGLDATDFQSQLTQNQAKTAEAEARLAQLTEQRKQTQQDLTALSADVDTKRSQRQEKQEWLAAAQAELAAKQRDQKRVQAQIKEWQRQAADLSNQVVALTDDHQAAGADSQTTSHQLKQAEAKRDTTEQKIQRVSDELTGLAEILVQSEADLTRRQELQRAALSEMNDFSARQSRLATLLDNDLTQLSETYGLSFEAAAEALADLPIDAIKKQLKLLKRGLDEIGDVNIGAIDEYQRVSDRYDFLARQQSDLVTSRQQLETTMAEMDEEVQTRFKAAFDEVAAAFSEIFVKMFGGGQARLQLTDPENLLTTGIDIMAQPPGKKFQRMSLLSGGERALTAITLLFATLVVRPVPFAILDETEAALDEANVSRFAHYLRDFGGETQFIVITHRKGTMVNANLLYGVTMQESGVSKMVSVSLDDLADDAS